MRSLVIAALLSAPALAGCLTPPEALDAASALPAVDSALALLGLEEGNLALDVPVDVVLVGFEAGVAEALRAALAEPESVLHAPSSATRTFPPSPDTVGAPGLTGESIAAAIAPRAVFRIAELPADAVAAFYEAAAAWTIEGAEGELDANAAEAWLARALAEAGLAPSPDRPSMVVLHGGEALGEHAWRYTYSHGWLSPVRAFGELEDLFVYDVSATPDPFVVSTAPQGIGVVFATAFGDTPTRPYDYPLEAGGAATVDALALLARESAHHRFLKGPLYPVSTRPCHHVTLLLAVHATSATEALPGFRRAAEWVDVAGLEAAFENLTADEVTVELKTLALPVDEPALDALSRGAAGFATLDALRWYLDENWENFVTVQEPCEEYLSLLLYGDFATQGAFGGIGMYDVQRSHRISFSLVSDQRRLENEYAGPGEEVVAKRDESMEWNRVNLLFSHEIGHTFGQHHPQHYSNAAGTAPTNHAFESVWSAMSYQTDDRTIDFGSNDRAQWLRNRASYAVLEARAASLEGTPEFESAMGHLGLYHWEAAQAALEPALEAARASGAPSASVPLEGVLGWHPHAGR